MLATHPLSNLYLYEAAVFLTHDNAVPCTLLLHIPPLLADHRMVFVNLWTYEIPVELCVRSAYLVH